MYNFELKYEHTNWLWLALDNYLWYSLLWYIKKSLVLIINWPLDVTLRQVLLFLSNPANALSGWSH